MPALPRKHGIGSNAVALGKTATANGRGLLLGNPHYPWHGILRFYQMHLTIPGKMDVMGVSLPGVPAVAIGFTKAFRSEERSVGKECVSTCRSRGSPEHKKKNNKKKNYTKH